MESILTAIIIVTVPAFDPLLMLFYGTAAYFGKTWTAAAAFGLLAGLAFVMVSLLIFGPPQKPVYLAGRFFACVLGAVIVRLVINALSKNKSAPAGD